MDSLGGGCRYTMISNIKMDKDSQIQGSREGCRAKCRPGYYYYYYYIYRAKNHKSIKGKKFLI